MYSTIPGVTIPNQVLSRLRPTSVLSDPQGVERIRAYQERCDLRILAVRELAKVSTPDRDKYEPTMPIVRDLDTPEQVRRMIRHLGFGPHKHRFLMYGSVWTVRGRATHIDSQFLAPNSPPQIGPVAPHEGE